MLHFFNSQTNPILLVFLLAENKSFYFIDFCWALQSENVCIYNTYIHMYYVRP